MIRSSSDVFPYFRSRSFEINSHLCQHRNGRALSQPDQPKQHVFSADEVVVKTVRFLPCERYYFLRAGRKVAHRFIVLDD